jgi:hypothetical protein
MSTPATSAPYGGDPPTIENRKVPLRRANVAYRSREYLSDKEVIPSYIFRGDGHVIDLDAIVAGVVGLTEFSGIWAYSPWLRRDSAARACSGQGKIALAMIARAKERAAIACRGFLHIPAKRSNPGSRRQSGLGSDPDFSQFPNDFVHIHRLWPFTEFVASV